MSNDNSSIEITIFVGDVGQSTVSVSGEGATLDQILDKMVKARNNIVLGDTVVLVRNGVSREVSDRNIQVENGDMYVVDHKHDNG